LDYAPLRATANMTSGDAPVRNNEMETKIKKRSAAEVIATPPVSDTRLRKNVIVSSLL
jgi:hypothetical protein